MARFLFPIIVFAAVFLLGFETQFYFIGRRMFRERGMAVPGWLIVAMMFVGAERAAVCHARLEHRRHVR